MRTFGILAAAAVGLMLLAGGAVLLWLWWAYPTYTYRFRLTVAIEVDGERRTGASVIEVRNRLQPTFGHAPPVVATARGEAVYVELGARGHVIAVLAFGPNAWEDRIATLVPRVFGTSLEEAGLQRLVQLQGRRELAGPDIPTLVTFADPGAPGTVRLVEPDDLDVVLGARFAGAWIELTRDPITRTIEERLPWLSDVTGYLGGSFDSTWMRPSRNLTRSHFIKGL
jgi:hypothetical protein